MYTPDISTATIRQFISCTALMCSSLLNGCKLGWIQAASSIFSSPNSPVNAAPEDVAWFATIPLPASIINVFICLWFVNNASRKKMVFFPILIQGLVWLVLCFTKSVPVMMFCMFAKGLTDNFLVGIVPAYIGEITTPKSREMVGFTYGLMFTVGKLLEYAIGANNYAILNIFPLIISILGLLTSVFMVESPYYLLAVDKPIEAKANLAWLNAETREDILEKEMDDARKFVEQNQDNSLGSGVLQILFRPDNLRLYLFYTLVYSLAHLTCEAIMTNYGFQIIRNLHTIIEGATFVNICNAIFIVGFVVSIFNLKKFDRRKLLFVGFLSLSIIQIICAFCFFIAEQTNYHAPISSNLITLCLFLVLFVYMITLTPALLILRSEIFEYKIKEFCGLSMNFLIDCVTFVELQAFFPLANVTGESFCVLLFGILSGIGAYCANRMRDTKNKSLLQIQLEHNAYSGFK